MCLRFRPCTSFRFWRGPFQEEFAEKGKQYPPGRTVGKKYPPIGGQFPISGGAGSCFHRSGRNHLGSRTQPPASHWATPEKIPGSSPTRQLLLSGSSSFGRGFRGADRGASAEEKYEDGLLVCQTVREFSPPSNLQSSAFFRKNFPKAEDKFGRISARQDLGFWIAWPGNSPNWGRGPPDVEEAGPPCPPSTRPNSRRNGYSKMCNILAE